jgi:hypothetical protein
MAKGISPDFTTIRGALKNGPTLRNIPNTPGIIIQNRSLSHLPPTKKQLAVRAAYSRLSSLWSSLPALVKAPYINMASRTNLNPFNCWLKVHLPTMLLSPLVYLPTPEGQGTSTINFAVGGSSYPIDGRTWTTRNGFPTLANDDPETYIPIEPAPFTETPPGFSIAIVLSHFDYPDSYRSIFSLNQSLMTPGDILLSIGRDFTALYTVTPDFNYSYLFAYPDFDPEELTSLIWSINGENSTVYHNGIELETERDGTFGPVPFTELDLLGSRFSSSAPTFPVYIAAIFPQALTQQQAYRFDTHYRSFLL